jgi:hypothetical protein
VGRWSWRGPCRCAGLGSRGLVCLTKRGRGKEKEGERSGKKRKEGERRGKNDNNRGQCDQCVCATSVCDQCVCTFGEAHSDDVGVAECAGLLGGGQIRHVKRFVKPRRRAPITVGGGAVVDGSRGFGGGGGEAVFRQEFQGKVGVSFRGQMAQKIRPCDFIVRTAIRL